MPEQDTKIKELEDRLDALVRTQIDFQKEISAIRAELFRLRELKANPERRWGQSFYVPEERASEPSAADRSTTPKPPITPPAPGVLDSAKTTPPVPPSTAAVENSPKTAAPLPAVEGKPPFPGTPRPQSPPPPRATQRPPVRESASTSAYEPPKRTPYVSEPVLSSATTSGAVFSRFVSQHTDKAKENLEEFVGKNLISLIGIVVLILGVGIGAKYAIDNNWISSLTRIVIGYIFGFGLVGLALKLRKNYHNFSAVLFSGGMAIMYFVTYFAYSLYSLLPQLGAFGLMILFTAFTVAGALVYSRQVVAHIGLVGAYAVPFLLSNDSGNYLALFIYMAVINAGILAVSLKKRWTPIFYTSSVFTWLIFGGWFATKYQAQAHFQLAIVFLAVFFAILYVTKIAQAKLLAEDEDQTENLVSSTLTVAVFYAICFAIGIREALGPAQYWTFFIYVAVASLLIVAASLRFFNHPVVVHVPVLLTWAVFGGWFANAYSREQYFELALIFLGVFFAISYAVALVEARFLEDEAERNGNLAATIFSGVIFYGFCFAIIYDTNSLGRHWALFTYVAAASVVILSTSLKFFDRRLIYLVLPCTWAIYGGWFANSYSRDQYFEFALVFLGVFFVISYVATLVRARLLKDQTEITTNLITSIIAGILFYGFCFAIVSNSNSLSQYWTVFTYVAVASAAILATSFKFFDRMLMYVVVPLSWSIYGGWFLTSYDPNQHFTLAAVFSALFFGIFYVSILFHRLIEDSFSLVEHTSLVLSNSFVFYGFGYLLLDGNEALRGYLGLYTAAHALLHLAVALVVRAVASKAVDVVQVLTVLVLTFASLAVPVQFEGNPVTMVWAVEAAILFWFGRTRGISVFEKYSYPVMLLAAGRLGLEWVMAYASRNPVTPVINSDFITAVVFVIAFGFIYLTNRNRSHKAAIDEKYLHPIGIAVATAGCIVLYNMFRIEIGNYFYAAAVSSVGEGVGRAVNDLGLFNFAWQINYTLFFFTAMAVVNLKKFRSTTLTFVNTILGLLTIGAFATISMFAFYELRTTFVAGTFDPDYVSHWLYIAIRPISYGVAIGLLYMIYEYTRDPLLEDRVDQRVLTHGFEAVAYTVGFIVAGCELTNLMGQFGIPDGTKLGLSILWGVYALMMIVVGIAWDKKHLRIAAIALLAVTLAKLFFYDIADLDTISKTILFVTLGITLLVISFLYNKYKGVIFKTDAVQED